MDDLRVVYGDIELTNLLDEDLQAELRKSKLITWQEVQATFIIQILRNSKESDTTTYVIEKDLPGAVFNRHWHCGGQLGRSIYASTEDKDWFIGMVDSRSTANHLVILHNDWVDRLRKASNEGKE
jgi:hypothetical protein